jgi:hypothetical protein
MARGWESKDVESQVASRENMAAPGKAQKAQDQLETATHPNHKKTLEAALAHLDQKLEQLK